MRTKQKNSPDWEEIRRQWQTKDKSIRALARVFSVDEKTIRKRVKSENWVSTLSPQSAASIQGEGERSGSTTAIGSALSNQSMALETLLAAAREGDVETVATHALTAIAKISFELDRLSDLAELLEAIVTEETANDKSPRRRQLLLKILDFPSRAQAARNIGSAMSIVGSHVPGKKARAQRRAEKVGSGASEWGNDLDPFSGDDEGAKAWKN